MGENCGFCLNADAMSEGVKGLKAVKSPNGFPPLEPPYLTLYCPSGSHTPERGWRI